MKTRIVFMGTPEFAVPTLERLAQEFEVVGCYSQPDRPVGRGLELKPTPVKRKALELGIPVFQPAKLSEPGVYEQLVSLRPDCIAVVAFGQLLKRNVLDLPRLGCINGHASLLPRWRGAAPIHWALLSGDAVTGVTSMRMVEKLDAGAMLLKRELPIGPRDTVTDLHDRLSQMTAEALCETVRGLERGEISDQAQDESLVTYASKLSKEMEFLDGSALDAPSLDRRVRALNPWPGTSVWVKVGEKSIRLKIKRAQWSRAVSADPGSIAEVHGVEGLYLGAKAGGSLRLESVQWDGRKEVDIAEFRNGLRGMGLALPLRTGPC